MTQEPKTLCSQCGAEEDHHLFCPLYPSQKILKKTVLKIGGAKALQIVNNNNVFENKRVKICSLLHWTGHNRTYRTYHLFKKQEA